MTRTRIAKLLALATLCATLCAPPRRSVAQASTPRSTNQTAPGVLSLNGEGWRFAVDPLKSGEANRWFAPDIDDARWDAVAVPHCWSVDPRYPFYTGQAWYRRTFKPDAATNGGHTRLRFGAVFYKAKVWLNDRPLGEHEGGYTPFKFDVSDKLKPGQPNVLVVCADNSWNTETLPGARPGADPTAQVYPWLDYGGIVRDVYLETSAPVFVHNQKIVATPDLQRGTADVDVTAFVINATDAAARVEIGVELTRDSDGRTVASWRTDSRLRTSVDLPPRSAREAKLRTTLERANVMLWDQDHPNLYRARAEVDNTPASSTSSGGFVPSRAHTATFGIRKFEVRGTQLLLNGEPIRMGGANRAGDHPVYGLLEPPEVVDADMRLMKQAGMEMSRTIHYALPPALLDWADRHGSLVIAEAGNWQLTPEQMDSPVIRRKWQAQMREMIERDWSHPSVVAWSVGNEYASDTPAGVRWTSDMKRFVNALDASRPVTFASHRVFRDTVKRAEDEGSAYVDFVGMNSYAAPADFGALLDRVHALHPNKPVFVTEFGKRADRAIFSRAVGAGSSEGDRERDDYFRGAIAEIRKRPWVAGASVWTFNDYRSRYPGTAANGYRLWGLVDEARRERSSYDVVRDEFAVARIEDVRRGDGGRRIEARFAARPDFPSYVLRGYTARVTLLDANDRPLQTRTLDLPRLAPGATHTAEFVMDEDKISGAARVRVGVVRPTGFTAAERTQELR